jgi:hypothetical protein
MYRLETPSIERREGENGLVYICCLRFVFTLYSLNVSFYEQRGELTNDLFNSELKIVIQLNKMVI